MRQVFAIFLLLVILAPAMNPTFVFAQDSFSSDDFGFTVSWSAEWTLNSKEVEPGLGSSIHLASGEFYIEYHAFVSGGREPAEAVAMFVELRRETEPELVVQSIFQLGGSTGPLPTVIVFDSEAGVRLREAITAQTLSQPDHMLIIVIGFPEFTNPQVAEQQFRGISLDLAPSSFSNNGSVESCEGYAEWRRTMQAQVNELGDAMDQANNALALPGLFRTGGIGMANQTVTNLLSDLLTTDDPPTIAVDALTYFTSAVSKYAAALNELSMQDLTNYAPVFTSSIQTNLSEGDSFLRLFASELTLLDQQCNYVGS